MSDVILQEIGRLLALEAKATPGPWVQGLEYDMEDGCEMPTNEVRGPTYMQSWNGAEEPVSDVVCEVGYSAHKRHKANLNFILAMGNCAPALLRLLAAKIKLEISDADPDQYLVGASNHDRWMESKKRNMAAKKEHDEALAAAVAAIKEADRG